MSAWFEGLTESGQALAFASAILLILFLMMLIVAVGLYHKRAESNHARYRVEMTLRRLILLLGQIGIDGGKAASDYRDHLPMLDQGADTATGQVGRLLLDDAVSRFESSHHLVGSAMYLARFDVPQIDTFELQDLHVDTPLQVTFEDDRTMFRVDHALMQLMFRHLYENAASHGRAGHMLVKRKGHTLEFEDDGVGMPMAAMMSAWDHGTKADGGGTVGRGLQIVKMVAAAHNGTASIRTASQAGRGIVVTIEGL